MMDEEEMKVVAGDELLIIGSGSLYELIIIFDRFRLKFSHTPPLTLQAL